jgi:hypothetical protein
LTFHHRTTATFWDCYAQLSRDLRDRADKQFDLLIENPKHPSLQLKPVGAFWSARVTGACRALAFRETDVFTWFWIGSHDDYERLLQS